MQNFYKIAPRILAKSLKILSVSLEWIVPLLPAVCNFENTFIFSLFPGCHDIIEF